MARKYIDRKGKEGEVAAEDEWAHITNIYGEETKIEAADALDVQDRNITFGDQERQKTTFEIVKDRARDAMDAAGNTGQYIRFVNAHIDNQKKEVDKIKKIKEKFDKEVKLLQSSKFKMQKLDKKSLEDLDIKTVTEHLHQILLEKGMTKSKLDNLRKEIVSVEKELQKHEKQIEDVSEELKNKKLLEDKKKDQMENIKDELSTLVKKYGVKNLSEVLEMVNASKS